jgi:hypothetical protein
MCRMQTERREVCTSRSSVWPQITSKGHCLGACIHSILSICSLSPVWRHGWPSDQIDRSVIVPGRLAEHEGTVSMIVLHSMQSYSERSQMTSELLRKVIQKALHRLSVDWSCLNRNSTETLHTDLAMCYSHQERTVILNNGGPYDSAQKRKRESTDQVCNWSRVKQLSLRATLIQWTMMIDIDERRCDEEFRGQRER